MYSIYIDESTTCVNCYTAVTYVVSFFEKLNSLLNRLDNRCTMHGSQSDALKWVRGS
jgi:hypothetical protein